MLDNSMYVGESWYYDFEVRPTDPTASVVITAATWTLSDGETESTGECSINGRLVKALITPPATGRYTLTVSVTVPPEVIINKLQIIVRE